MGLWDVIKNILGLETTTQPALNRQPTADSSILNTFFDLKICIKQHAESFYSYEDPSILRQRIGKEIFECITSGFDDKQMPTTLDRSTKNERLNEHVNVIWETGKSLRNLLLEQPNGIWRWGQWHDPDGYIVVFPSIWKAGLMVREWEIVKRR